ncbi:MAG TPA: hypothetical protein VGK92_10550 [Gaiellales bacterium]|jgi:hypothetical protein
MATWRLTAGHTHLYPGAELRFVEAPGARVALALRDDVLIELSDGQVAVAEIVALEPLELFVSAHRTRAGTEIQPNRWRLEERAGDAAVLKLRRPTSGRARTGG